MAVLKKEEGSPETILEKCLPWWKGMMGKRESLPEAGEKSPVRRVKTQESLDNVQEPGWYRAPRPFVEAVFIFLEAHPCWTNITTTLSWKRANTNAG